MYYASHHTETHCQCRRSLYLFIKIYSLSLSLYSLASNRFFRSFRYFRRIYLLFVHSSNATAHCVLANEKFSTVKLVCYHIKNNDDVDEQCNRTLVSLVLMANVNMFERNRQHVKSIFRCCLGKSNDPTVLIGYLCSLGPMLPIPTLYSTFFCSVFVCAVVLVSYFILCM